MSAETICVAQVLAPNPAFHSLLVQFRSAQIPTQPVRMMYNGPADPLSIHQAEMPKAGTWGLVAFPNGDINNGIWMGAINGDWRDPIMGGTLSGDDCAVADDPLMAYTRYEAQWTGAWTYSGYDQDTEAHKLAHQWPDSSSLVLGVDFDIPTIYRQTVDDGQNRIQVEYVMEDRVGEPPDTPFELQYVHGSSTTFTVDSGGDLFVLGATDKSVLGNALDAPATFDVTFGGTVLAIGPADPSLIDSDLPAVSASTAGDMNMIGNLEPAASWTASFAGALIEIDHDGNINIESPGTISVNGQTISMTSIGTTSLTTATTTMTSAGTTSISGSAIIIDSTTLTNVIIDGHVFDLHTHIAVETGTGISGPVGT